ncbi:protein of unknown function [Nitrospira defluvii]|uniref:Uncharacterized protein n=1 Tax=Nitrospira defluvii TaxID=330214 RepID=D8PE67_9BACT|nr:protein of unknown function [Nitrospira defluvii]
MIDFNSISDDTTIQRAAPTSGRAQCEGADMKKQNARQAVVKPEIEAANPMMEMVWRLERLERQVQRLSELVRNHAEDNDRLVRIVAEDRDVIRRELLRKHEHRVRVRKHLRDVSSKVDLEH